jgi:hypothetical protein
MIPAGCRHDPGPGQRPRQQVRKRAARLERSGVLMQFQLEPDAIDCQAEIAAGRVDNRRLSDVRPNQPFGFRDLFGCDLCRRLTHAQLVIIVAMRNISPAADRMTRTSSRRAPATRENICA